GESIDRLVPEQPREADRATARPDPGQKIPPLQDESVQALEVRADDVTRAGEDRVAGSQADQGEDLRRGRRPDRRVVLELRASGEQVAVADGQTGDPEARQ